MWGVVGLVGWWTGMGMFSFDNLRDWCWRVGEVVVVVGCYCLVEG